MQRSGGPDSHSGAGHGGSADRNLPSPHANAWLFSAQDPAPLSSASSSKTATDSASSHLLSASPMIGPGPSYYDPESASAQQHAQAQNYQQWIDNYGRQREDIHHLQQQQQHRHHHQQRQHQQQPSPRELAYQQHTYGVPGYGVDAPPGGTGSLAHYPSAAYGQQPLPSHQQHPRQQQAPPNDMFPYFPSDVAQTYPGQFSPQDYPPMSASASVSASVVPSPTQWADADAFRGPPVDRSVSASHATGASSAPPAPTQANKRKRARKTPERAGNSADSDSDSDDDGGGRPAFTGGISVGMGGLGVKGQKQNSSRLPGACTHCKKLKMKCEFKKNENTCKRCQSGGHVCIVEGRKPRTAPNKREYLLAQIRQKDAIIESLLKQLHNPYIATPLSIASYRMATSPSDSNNKNILAWLDRLQASVQSNGTTIKEVSEANKGREMSVQSAGEKAPGAFTLDVRAIVRDDGEESDEEYSGEKGTDSDDDDEDGSSDKLRNLPDMHVPLGLIANLSLSNKPKSGKAGKKNATEETTTLDEDDLDDDNVGVANETYFMPGPATDLGKRAMLIEQHSPPEILVHGLVAPEDVDKLFDIFYNKLNPFISLLDPVLHTPALTFARCPFLFTVICAISSRYYTEKSEIYPIAMHFAKHSAATALIDGWKSVELCQAYILMSIYAVPARRWEEDRSWLYTGLAIRIATDLNLHQVSTAKPSSERHEREILNRTRVWLICFNLDRSTATQFGKPSTIKEDYIVQHAKDWYKKSKYNLNHDVHLCAYNALLRIIAKFHEEVFSDTSSPTGLNKRLDFCTVTLKHDEHLTKYHEEWAKIFREESDHSDSSSEFRCLLLPFLVNYSRLVMFSFGFQQAYHRGIKPGDHSDQVFFTKVKCLESAKAVIQNMVDKLAPSGYMRYAPDGHFIFASFASAFLLK
ncbi:fungal-specific transcription factor domain-containing protein, partial [Schizophyllum commune]